MSRLQVDASPWPASNVATRLLTADVVLCSVSLEATDDTLHDAIDTLSSEDRVRFASFTHDIVARRYAIGRAALRAMLGQVIGVAPALVPIRDGLHGKPHLAREASPFPLWFSLAHSEELCVIAMSRVAEVGVDLERSRAVEQWARVAGRVLDPRERAELALAVEQGDDPGVAFLRHWCRVEAELKAIGCGIAGLEAHRAGHRPHGLRLADLRRIPLPASLDRAGLRFQGAVALCTPAAESVRQTSVAATQAALPTASPASASTA